MDETVIRIGHGSGGRLTRELIHEIFRKRLSNRFLDQLSDSAIIPITGSNLALTTDSYVIDPIFFPGGDIGKLAVCGTVNDLCVTGATPRYMSAGFILEEGFAIDQLVRIVESMANEAHKAGILIVTGDTKVVKKGQCDKIFINTSGIGYMNPDRVHISSGSTIKPGDKIILTGSLGDHAISIMTARENLTLEEEIISDAASMNLLTEEILKVPEEIHFMRDITRGGLGTILAEICDKRSFGLEINENNLMVKRSVKAVCELYGFDPLYLANEGKILIIVNKISAEKIVKELKKNSLGENAQIIGEITDEHPGRALMKSIIGGKRIIDMLSGEMLPRIC
jgi:hydrogenase expression/formation protein HypE